MRNIEISTETFAAIWAKRMLGEENEDQILSRILGGILDEGVSPEGVRKFSGKTAKSQEAEIGHMRWVDDVRLALTRMGGTASLFDIYKVTKEIRTDGGRSLPRTFEATIRRTLEDHSSDSANHRAEDLFRLVSRGVWALR